MSSHKTLKMLLRSLNGFLKFKNRSATGWAITNLMKHSSCTVSNVHCDPLSPLHVLRQILLNTPIPLEGCVTKRLHSTQNCVTTVLHRPWLFSSTKMPWVLELTRIKVFWYWFFVWFMIPGSCWSSNQLEFLQYLFSLPRYWFCFLFF